MAGVTPPGDGLTYLVERLDHIDEQLRDLQRPTGTSIAGLLQQVQQAIINIGTTVTAYLSGGFTTGSMTATGNVTANGTVQGDAGLRSMGVFSTDVTALPGTRTPVWVNGTAGVLGQTISTIAKKTHLSESLPFTAAQVMECIPYVYEYIGQVAIREDPANEYFDPEYVVPTEIGLMAEHLIEHSLGVFVFYEQDGVTPKGIDYALFGAIANLVVLRDHEDRLRAAGL